MKVNLVSCAAWVPQGAAKANPDKVEVTAEDLKRIIQETESKLSNASIDDDTESPENENNAEDVNKEDCESMDVDGEADEDETNLEKMYKFDKYDEEPDSNLGDIVALRHLTTFASCQDDPLIVTLEKDEDELSEAENHAILPNDNLIAVGHVEEDAAILEVYVYNESEGSLYVHHDNLLPAMPLCMEWLNYNPFADRLKPGNLVAVGTMSPVIEIWDLDLIDGLEPAFKLGRSATKKKKTKKSDKVKKEKAYGHKSDVLALAWNREYEHVLASGAADGEIILWDLQELAVSRSICCFSGRVQCLQWHPHNGSKLLAGASDGQIQVISCTNKDFTCSKWTMEGEVERALWVFDSDRECVLASSNTGDLACIDVAKKEKLVWNFKPHDSSCTGLQLSSACPGLLVTGSEDGKLRVWDTAAVTAGGKHQSLLTAPPALVVELYPQVGRVFCLTAALEQPFVFCIGGDQGDNCFKVWDIRASRKVREIFCPRLGLPVDDDEGDMTRLKAQQEEERESVGVRFMGGKRGHRNPNKIKLGSRNMQVDKTKKHK